MTPEVAAQLLKILRQEETCEVSHTYLSILAAGLDACWAKTNRSIAGQPRPTRARRRVRG